MYRLTAQSLFRYLTAALALISPSLCSGALNERALTAGPSFHCDPALVAAERVVCRDPELSAYDRALVAQYKSRRVNAARRRSQRAWLAQRNACDARRECIVDAYRRGLSLTDLLTKAETLSREVLPPSGGSDLLLRYQSPTPTITPISSSTLLTMRSLGGELYAFEVSAVYIYEPHDGRGTNSSDGGASGFVYLRKNIGRFGRSPETLGECVVDFTRLPAGAWKLTELGRCSGIGASLTGVYVPDRHRGRR